MIKQKRVKMTARRRRARRVRRKIMGTSERPRLSVSRSLRHISAQIIDDVQGTTLVGFSSLSPDIRNTKIEGGKTATAKEVGKKLAEKAKEKGIQSVVFDRAGYLYHGRVKAIAEGAREGGLQF